MVGRLCPVNHSQPHAQLSNPCVEPIPRPPRAVSSGLPRISCESVLGEIDATKALLGGLQRQCDDDRSRLAFLERKLEVWSGNGYQFPVVDQAKTSQGDHHKLEVFVQRLVKRVEGFSEHVSARDVIAQLSSQQLVNLERSVSILERQVEDASMLAKEAHVSQSATGKQTQHVVEDMAQRLSLVEQHCQFEICSQRGMLDRCVCDMEKGHAEMERHVEALLATLEERMLDSSDSSTLHVCASHAFAQSKTRTTTKSADLRVFFATAGRDAGIFADGVGPSCVH